MRRRLASRSVILHFSTGSICYHNPNNDSSDPIKIKCSFPENFCFKFDKKTEDNKQVTIQGCISADQCRQFDDQHLQCCEGDLCNHSKCHGYRKQKFINLGAKFWQCSKPETNNQKKEKKFRSTHHICFPISFLLIIIMI